MFKVFAGEASIALAKGICDNLGCEMGRVNITHFSDGEFGVCYEESIRGQIVFLVQSTYPNADNLMEYPFTKEEGSARGYIHGEDGRVIPIKSDYEFEGMEDKQYTHDMQEGALHFVGLIKSSYGVREISWQAGYRNVKNVTKCPRIKDVRLLGRLSHVNHGRRVFLAVPKSRWEYLFHPRQLKEDFIDSGWKIGFLKSLFLLPLPYNCILKLIRKN